MLLHEIHHVLLPLLLIHPHIPKSLISLRLQMIRVECFNKVIFELEGHQCEECGFALVAVLAGVDLTDFANQAEDFAQEGDLEGVVEREDL